MEQDELELLALEYTEGMTIQELEAELQVLEDLPFLTPREKKEKQLLELAYKYYLSFKG